MIMRLWKQFLQILKVKKIFRVMVSCKIELETQISLTLKMAQAKSVSDQLTGKVQSTLYRNEEIATISKTFYVDIRDVRYK